MKLPLDGLHRSPLALLALTLALIIAMIGSYGFTTVQRHHHQFLQEAQLYQKAVRFQTDRIIMRIKDAAAFVSSGIDDRTADKANTPQYRTIYNSEFGYFKSSDPQAIRRFVGKDFSIDYAQAEELRKLLTLLKRSESWVTTVRPSDWPGMFPSVKPGEVVMMQALRTTRSANDYNIIYAVANLKGIVEDAAIPMEYVMLSSVDFSLGTKDAGWLFETTKSWPDVFMPPMTQVVDIDITRNAKLLAVLKKSYLGLQDLFVMIIGFVLVGVLSIGFFVMYWRAGRQARHHMSVALEKAHQASEAKSIFVANMSHEIRTPLNGVLGMAELLRRTELTQTQRRYADQISSSGSVLLSILNDVIDLSKIESGQLAIDPIPTRLPSLLMEIVAFYAESAHAKNLEVLVDIDPNLPETVDVDPIRLRQILGNLLSNAVKFTREGEVVLSARRRPAETGSRSCVIDFSVKDTGIGMSEDCIKRLFSRFMQAESSTTRVYGGSGLGLSICKEICEMMGGTIQVTSETDKGSTFSFTLALPVLEELEVPVTPGIRLALVSPSASMKTILRDSLTAYGIDCVCFEPTVDITERLLKAQDTLGAFSLVVLDEGQHISQAVKVRQLLEAKAGLCDLPAIVLGKQQVSSSYQRFDEVVIKPFDSRVLSDAIRRLAQSVEGVGVFAPYGKLETASEAPSYHGHRALLVDDNNVNLLFGGEVLEGLGFDVTLANDGAKAIKAAEAETFSVIIMDCQMPVMDGYETTGHLRKLMAEGQIARTPIIAVTANALKGDRERCLAAGMDAFLTKPMSISQLEAALELLMPCGKTQADHRSPRADPPEAAEQAVLPVMLPVKVQATICEPSPVAPLPAASELLPFDGAAAAQPVEVDNVRTLLSSPAPRARVPLVDAALFDQTRRAVSKFDTLVSFYLDDTERYLQSIREAMAVGRIEDAVLPAHTIKSSSRIIGALGLAHLAEQFEKRARLDGPARVSELNVLRVHMERLFGLTRQTIEKLRETEDLRSAS